MFYSGWYSKKVQPGQGIGRSRPLMPPGWTWPPTQSERRPGFRQPTSARAASAARRGGVAGWPGPRSRTSGTAGPPPPSRATRRRRPPASPQPRQQGVEHRPPQPTAAVGGVRAHPLDVGRHLCAAVPRPGQPLGDRRHHAGRQTAGLLGVGHEDAGPALAHAGLEEAADLAEPVLVRNLTDAQVHDGGEAQDLRDVVGGCGPSLHAGIMPYFPGLSAYQKVERRTS